MLRDDLITGIQQVGIGVRDVDEAFTWYRRTFGFDIPLFDDQATANLMAPYTGGTGHSRRALLAMNLAGGGGFEIWQFKSREPQPCAFKPELGDLGILAVKLKSSDVVKFHNQLIGKKPPNMSRVAKDPDGYPIFTLEDPYGNLFQIVNGDTWFSEKNSICGGVCGVMIGVSDVDAAMPLYTEVLGFDQVIYDESGVFYDLPSERQFRRVLLRKSQHDVGAFSRLLGHIDVELIQSLDREGRKIFANRYWGDLGYIHVCFDVNDMEGLQEACGKHGYSFTVDSADSFDMGEAAGRFSYIEDPDGTLIEFVETHKMPILKKLGWHIDLKKRKGNRPLPDWMLKTLSIGRVKG